MQVDPAVHCMMQVTSASLASVAALDLTITSDSCTRIREHMQLGCRRMRPQLRSCVPATTWVVAIMMDGSRRVTQARSTGNASTPVAYSSRPVTRWVRPKRGKHCARQFETESQIGLVTRRDRRRTCSTVALSQGAEACIRPSGPRARSNNAFVCDLSCATTHETCLTRMDDTWLLLGVGVTCAGESVRQDARKRHAASGIRVRPPLWYGVLSLLLCAMRSMSFMSCHPQDGKPMSS